MKPGHAIIITVLAFGAIMGLKEAISTYMKDSNTSTQSTKPKIASCNNLSSLSPTVHKEEKQPNPLVQYKSSKKLNTTDYFNLEGLYGDFTDSQAHKDAFSFEEARSISKDYERVLDLAGPFFSKLSDSDLRIACLDLKELTNSTATSTINAEDSLLQFLRYNFVPLYNIIKAIDNPAKFKSSEDKLLKNNFYHLLIKVARSNIKDLNIPLEKSKGLKYSYLC